MKISDEMIERAAKALEKTTKQSTYEWNDEQFEIWWNKDPNFVSRETSWGILSVEAHRKLISYG